MIGASTKNRQARPITRATQRQSAEAAEKTSLAPELFARFQELIYRQTGIWLASHKTALLTGRLSRRLRALELQSMSDYYRLISQPDQQLERQRMIDCITTNETHFFREPRHFEFLEQQVFPQWRKEAETGKRPQRIRVWSAGCASGEETYSLAMMLCDFFPAESGWQIEIVGTDISMRVLEKARTGIYPIDRMREIPEKYLQAHVLKGIEDQKGFMKMAPELQRLVIFSQLNLNLPPYTLAGNFDLIFCRNVLIYFDHLSKSRVVSGLLHHLAPSGLLVVGHSESLHGILPDLKTVVPTIYTHGQAEFRSFRSRKQTTKNA